ncbi:interleukin-20 receptor subunit beta isoform X2 [Canis lupus dingo]|uniref:interleukin-20 receptor subunit beta isoform X2 n=1 Tax=Canis lupus dingo TaxID=286419 RepID=UPI0020C1E603|nr:interleukin-20 receptor subunit beta isoform X2 [Canis lupus dingo]
MFQVELSRQTQTLSVVLEEILTSPIMWFFCALIPCLLIGCFLDIGIFQNSLAGLQKLCIPELGRVKTSLKHLYGVAVLPAPQNLSVQSTNMKHLLTWSPVIVPGEIIYYFVEYQGEYESLYMSHIWIPSSWCSPTEGPACDITDDITATVPYNLRVRATLGSQTSAWSTLQHPFNRNSTILTPPVMEVTKDGFHLVIKLEDLGPQFEFLVAYWRREPDAKEHVKVVRSRGIPVHLETMEPGAAYCVKVRTFVKAIGRHSPFSQAECVKVQGEALPLALALFAFFGFTLMLVVMPLSVWKMGRLLRYSCCPVVVLPDTLRERKRAQAGGGRGRSRLLAEQRARCGAPSTPGS